MTAWNEALAHRKHTEKMMMDAINFSSQGYNAPWVHTGSVSTTATPAVFSPTPRRGSS